MGARKHALEEVPAAIGIGERGLPPAEARRIAVLFTRPGDAELKRKDPIEGVRGDRGGHGGAERRVAVRDKDVTTCPARGKNNRRKLGHPGSGERALSRQPTSRTSLKVED